VSSGLRSNLAGLLVRVVQDEDLHASLVDDHIQLLLDSSLPSKREFHDRAALWNLTRLEAVRGLQRRIEELSGLGGPAL
jgi:hypothetical protein